MLTRLPLAGQHQTNNRTAHAPRPRQETTRGGPFVWRCAINPFDLKKFRIAGNSDEARAAFVAFHMNRRAEYRCKRCGERTTDPSSVSTNAGYYATTGYTYQFHPCSDGGAGSIEMIGYTVHLSDARDVPPNNTLSGEEE